MENKEPDIEKIYLHWIGQSERDFDTMNTLYNAGDYHWALFIGHLVIEKLLKAKIVKETGSHAPYIHDLRRLAKLSGIEFDDTQKRILDTLTTFNIATRYDDYKQEFYKKCTKDYASEWINKINEIRIWIKSKL